MSWAKFMQTTNSDRSYIILIMAHWNNEEVVYNFFYLLSVIFILLLHTRYTSLGSQDNTLPNPLLETRDRIGQVVYLPAYTLKEEDMERKGRISSKH